MIDQSLRRPDELLSDSSRSSRPRGRCPCPPPACCPRERMLDLLDGLREALPGELGEARQVLGSRDAMLQSAHDEATHARDSATAQADALLSDADAPQPDDGRRRDRRGAADPRVRAGRARQAGVGHRGAPGRRRGGSPDARRGRGVLRGHAGRGRPVRRGRAHRGRALGVRRLARTPSGTPRSSAATPRTTPTAPWPSWWRPWSGPPPPPSRAAPRSLAPGQAAAEPAADPAAFDTGPIERWTASSRSRPERRPNQPRFPAGGWARLR